MPKGLDPCGLLCVIGAVQLRHTFTVAKRSRDTSIINNVNNANNTNMRYGGMDDSSDGLAEILKGTKHERTFCRSSARLLRAGVFSAYYFSVTSKLQAIWADASSFSFRFFQQCPPSRKAAVVVVHRRRMLRRR